MPLEKDLSKDEWLKVCNAFDSAFGYCTLLCDGHRVTLEARLLKRRLVMGVFVDGWFRGSWTKESPEYKFLCPIIKPLYSPKDIALARKMYGKAIARARAQSRFSIAVPWWSSFVKFRAHMRKVCTTIEMVGKDDDSNEQA